MGKIKRLILFFVCNAFVFAGFSVLWVHQYRMDPNLSDRIDHITVPWGWLLTFFTASICTLNNKTPLKTILISLGCAIGFSFILSIFGEVVLSYYFDPDYEFYSYWDFSLLAC